MPYSYTKVTVTRPGGPGPGVGGKKLDRIILFDMDDVSTFPERGADGITVANNIIMKANTKMISVYGTVNTIKTGSTSEGDMDAEGFVHSVEFEHPGNSVAIRAMKTCWLGKNIGIIILYCDDEKGKSLFGLPCCPMRMQVKQEDNKDKNSSVFTFKMLGKTQYDVAHYTGNITLDTPIPSRNPDPSSTVDADATSIDISDGYESYYLTDGTSSAALITTCTGATAGQVFTLVGSGGDHPSTLSTDFMLAEGLAWTALEGAKITFQAFKTGSSTWKFIELSRE